ncbi:MAG: response regulator [Magnetococcales bacterium]|nr:response regulator [Magnetococcales bacterium]
MSSDLTPCGPAAPDGVRRLKTLIVDDHPASILLLQDMLADCCECFAATSGPQAIALFEKAIKDMKPFDVVLLDIEMPGMSGIEVLKEMRAQEVECRKRDLLFNTVPFESKRYTRIIMQTASENPQDLFDSYLKGKCNGYINKPFRKSELLEKVLAIS